MGAVACGWVVAACVACASLPWGPGRRASRLRFDRAGEAPFAIGSGRPVTSGRPAAVSVDVVLVLELVDAAVATGVALPRALVAVGSAIGGARGEALRRAGSALVLGASWSTAWSGAGDALPVVADALEAAWVTGSAPGPALRACADAVRRERRGRVREAAGSLGVRLVLPLGVCFLPAFVLLGIVPVVLSFARGLAL